MAEATKILPCGRKVPKTESDTNKKELETLRGRLREYLSKNKLKDSEQRWQIAETILTSNRHLTAQDVVKVVQEKHPKIGVATIYRNLKVLTQAYLLRESMISPAGQVIYEAFDEEHHDHVVCLDCGHIFEFHDAAIEKRQDAQLKALRFQHVRHRHVLYAKCDFSS